MLFLDSDSRGLSCPPVCQHKHSSCRMSSGCLTSSVVKELVWRPYRSLAAITNIHSFAADQVWHVPLGGFTWPVVEALQMHDGSMSQQGKRPLPRKAHRGCSLCTHTGGSMLNLQPETGHGMANTKTNFHIKNAFAG